MHGLAVACRRVVARGRDYRDLSQSFKGLLEGSQTGRSDLIVIREQDVHSLRRLGHPIENWLTLYYLPFVAQQGLWLG